MKVFPAGAGVILTMYNYIEEMRSFPRRCGGDPQDKAVYKECSLFSPQVRG